MVSRKKGAPPAAVTQQSLHAMPSAQDLPLGSAAAEATDTMDAFLPLPDLSAALDRLQTETAQLSSFLQPSESIAQCARKAAKALFAYTSSQALQSGPSQSASAAAAVQANRGVLPELHVDGFDAEQVWLQLELQTEALLKRAQRQLKTLSADTVTLVTPAVERDIDTLLKDAGVEQPASSTSDDELVGEAEEALLLAGKKRRRASGAAAGKQRAAKLPVEDDFLNLEDMERFVRDAEMAAERDDEEDEDEDEDEDGGAAPSGSDGSEEDDGLDDVLARSGQLVGRSIKPSSKQKGKKGGRGLAADRDLEGAEELRYEDFFGSRGPGGPDDDDGAGGDGYGDGDEGLGAGRRRQRFSAGGDEDYGDEDEGGGEDEDEGDDEGSEDDDEQLRGSRKKQRWLEDGNEDEDGDYGDEDEMGDGLSDHEVEEDEENGGKDVGAAAQGHGAKVGKGGKGGAATEKLSAHERRLLRLQENIRSMEEEAMREKEWHMRGEIDASRRPLNSALEVDMDFETTQRPVPQPTDESTADVEEMIRRRIAEGRFDDPIRIVAAPPEKKKVALELDDSKSKKGLGELYEEQYVRAVTGVSEDKDEKVRTEAKALFAALCAKLDALTHFHYAPKPVVQELEVRTDIAAIAMEEVAPLVVSTEAMRRPDEVYKPTAEGKPLAEGELSREDRKRRRAQKKRGAKLHKEAEAEKRKVTPVTLGGEGQLAGRRSEAGEKAAAKAAKKAVRESRRGGKSEFSKSATVFKKLQEQRDQPDAGAKQKQDKVGPKASGAAFKL